jgi:uncharacterized membrane protein YtjA (UPF0391 family)
VATELSPNRGRRPRQVTSLDSFGRYGDPGTLVPPQAYSGITRGTHTAPSNRGCAMFGWVVTFLIVALIAGVLGFGGIAGASIEIAKAIFFIAIILFLISAVVGLIRGRNRA